MVNQYWSLGFHVRMHSHRRGTKHRAALSHPVSNQRETGRVSPPVSPQANRGLLSNWVLVSLCPGIRRDGRTGSVSRQQLHLQLRLGIRCQPQWASMLYTFAGPHSPCKQRGQTPNAGTAFNFHWNLHNQVLNPPTWEDTGLRQSYNNTGISEAV